MAAPSNTFTVQFNPFQQVQPSSASYCTNEKADNTSVKSTKLQISVQFIFKGELVRFSKGIESTALNTVKIQTIFKEMVYTHNICSIYIYIYTQAYISPDTNTVVILSMEFICIVYIHKYIYKLFFWGPIFFKLQTIVTQLKLYCTM